MYGGLALTAELARAALCVKPLNVHFLVDYTHVTVIAVERSVSYSEGRVGSNEPTIEYVRADTVVTSSLNIVISMSKTKVSNLKNLNDGAYGEDVGVLSASFTVILKGKSICC